MFKLAHFRVLHSVARNGGLVPAAVQLNRSSSAVSLTLKQLEEEVGGRLFEGDRKSKLTPLGRFIVEETRPLLEHYDRIVQAIRHHADGAPGQLDIACVPSIAATIVPDAITATWKSRPGSRVEIRDMDSHSVTQAVLLGTVEIGLASAVGRRDELTFTPLLSDPLDVVCAQDDPLAKSARPVEWDEVRARPFLGNGSYTATPSSELDRINSDRIMYIANVISIQAAVRAHIGITILPRMMRNSAMTGVAFVPLADASARRTVHAICRKGHRLSPIGERFLSLLRAILDAKRQEMGIELFGT
ncbi:LysR family transcriptional regulator [Nitratireductor alexandrii]|uniref:LysR family transcriptional regulator n=1 Tax=Nitratireductor alexandrii TaxID=2448161 RepID=UPI000FDCA55F|nr:LysR family transcriptional regulator [Nitratireductor alexandrii]